MFLGKKMRGMILAAGVGERMQPLTDTCPKPLIQVKDKPLVEYQIEALKKNNIFDIVINTHHKAKMIEDYLGNGEKFGVRIYYSHEHELLDTGGGIKKALPKLGKSPFIIINADIITDFELKSLPLRPKQMIHLVLVNNPNHNPNGDFALNGDRITKTGTERYTYAGIGLFRPEAFSDIPKSKFQLSEVINKYIESNEVTGQIFDGKWLDVGTQERLDLANVS